MLALSCEEAGRLLFTHTKPLTFTETDMAIEWDDSYAEGENESDWFYIRQARDEIIAMLQDRTHNIGTRISYCLQFAKQVQDAINHEQEERILQVIQNFRIDVQESTLQSLSTEKQHRFFQKRMDILNKMEILDEEWRNCLKSLHTAYYDKIHAKEYQIQKESLNRYQTGREYEYEQLLVYFVFRYVIRSVYDNNFLDKMKFSVFCYLTICDMDVLRFMQNGAIYTKEDRIDIARIFSKEVEHSEDNLEYLADAMLFESVCDTECLCHQAVLSYGDRNNEQQKLWEDARTKKETAG